MVNGEWYDLPWNQTVHCLPFTVSPLSRRLRGRRKEFAHGSGEAIDVRAIYVQVRDQADAALAADQHALTLQVLAQAHRALRLDAYVNHVGLRATRRNGDAVDR